MHTFTIGLIKTIFLIAIVFILAIFTGMSEQSYITKGFWLIHIVNAGILLYALSNIIDALELYRIHVLGAWLLLILRVSFFYSVAWTLVNGFDYVWIVALLTLINLTTTLTREEIS